MDRITKNQRIKSLENTVASLTKAVNKLSTWSVYTDSLLTELSHALPDPEHDAECEQSVIAVDDSLDRHAVRLGLSEIRTLSQSVFYGLAEEWKWAAVDEDGEACVYDGKPIIQGNQWIMDGGLCFLRLRSNYEAANWKKSLIEREVAELSLSEPQSALRGSELTKKLLEDQKLVVCRVSKVSDCTARIRKCALHVIEKCGSDEFVSCAGELWPYAIPIDPITGNEITELPLPILKPADILRCTDPHDYFQGGANYLVCESDEGPVVFDGSRRPWLYSETAGDQLLFRHYLFDTPAAFVKSEVTYG